MVKSTCTLCLHLLAFGLASCLSALAQDDTKPVELDEIVVTPGRFAIDDGTPSKLSLSKHRIERFPLIGNDAMRSAHIFPGSLQAITAPDSAYAAAKKTIFWCD